MKLTAEYLESKGWVYLCMLTRSWEIEYENITYGVLLNKNGLFDMYGYDEDNFIYFATDIRTQSRFDRLWSAITEQD